MFKKHQHGELRYSALLAYISKKYKIKKRNKRPALQPPVPLEILYFFPPHYYKYRKLCLLNGRKRIWLLIWSRGEFTGSQTGTLSKEEEFERKSPENRPSVPDAAAAAQPSNSMRLRCVHRPASCTSSPGEWRVGELRPSSSDSPSARFQPD